MFGEDQTGMVLIFRRSEMVIKKKEHKGLEDNLTLSKVQPSLKVPVITLQR